MKQQKEDDPAYYASLTNRPSGLIFSKVENTEDTKQQTC